MGPLKRAPAHAWVGFGVGVVVVHWLLCARGGGRTVAWVSPWELRRWPDTCTSFLMRCACWCGILMGRERMCVRMRKLVRAFGCVGGRVRTGGLGWLTCVFCAALVCLPGPVLGGCVSVHPYVADIAHLQRVLAGGVCVGWAGGHAPLPHSLVRIPPPPFPRSCA